MVLLRIGDALAALALTALLLLTTRSGGEWLLILSLSEPGPKMTVGALLGAGLAVFAVLGWVEFRLTGAASVVLGLAVALVIVVSVGLGYPAYDRHRQLARLAAHFSADFGPTIPVAAPHRVMLAEYSDGVLLGNGVQCRSGCRALLTGGHVEEVILAANFNGDPAGMSARLDRSAPGCAGRGGCIRLGPAAPGSAPRILMHRSHTTLSGNLATDNGHAQALQRAVIYRDNKPILQRSSVAVPIAAPLARPMPALTGPGLRDRVTWLSPHDPGGHGGLPALLHAVTE